MAVIGIFYNFFDPSCILAKLVRLEHSSVLFHAFVSVDKKAVFLRNSGMILDNVILNYFVYFMHYFLLVQEFKKNVFLQGFPLTHFLLLLKLVTTINVFQLLQCILVVSIT